MHLSDRPDFINDQLARAYCDFFFLLDRGYPKISALNFVGNHYLLDKNQRNILNRVTNPMEDVQIIQKHLVQHSDLQKNIDVYVDTYNQLITLYSIMKNDPIIICRDGVIRDIFSSLHVESDLHINHKLISYYLSFIVKLNPKKVIFYLDMQRSHSKDHASLISELMSEFNIFGECMVKKAVDWHLKKQNQAIIISHDSTVLIAAPYCFDIYFWLINSEILNESIVKNIINFQKITCY